MICTFYSHETGFEKITELLKSTLPKGTLVTSKQGESDIAEYEIKEGFFGSSKKIKITYRQRRVLSYTIPEENDSDLTGNLKGLYGYVRSLPAKNEKVKNLFLNKILTINSEFSVSEIKGETKELKELIQKLAQDFDAIIFAQPKTTISKSSSQHFLDKNLNLIIDASGNCEIDALEVKINSVHFDGNQTEGTEDQKTRKIKNEKIIEEKRIKLNKNLPFLESETDVSIRSAKEIAERVTVLCITNLVAFNSISGEQAIEYLKEHSLWELTTEKEKDFLSNPTEDKRSWESWKCEGIWTMMWTLKVVDALGFPDQLCNLDNIPAESYPVGQNKNPKDFINSMSSTRSKSEILDANDLYYRLDWACVDARINNKNIAEVNPGVVYERHYALNWLVNYRGQEWDDVTCDT